MADPGALARIVAAVARGGSFEFACAGDTVVADAWAACDDGAAMLHALRLVGRDVDRIYLYDVHCRLIGARRYPTHAEYARALRHPVAFVVRPTAAELRAAADARRATRSA